MNLYYLVAGAAAVVLIVWVVFYVRRSSSASSVAVPATVPRSNRTWMLIQGDAGPQFVSCYYDAAEHGYRVEGRFYPREFTRVMEHGLVVLATHMLMPADGDTKHGGHYGDLKEVEQPAWCAAWDTYDQARRRLNWAAVWSRGDGSMAGLKTLASAMQVVVLLILMFTIFSLRSNVVRNNDSLVVLSGQVARLSGAPDAPAIPRGAVDPVGGSLVPPVVDPNAKPLGDKP